MRVFHWSWRIILFVVLLGFALQNTETVQLRFYGLFTWQVPLIVLLLSFLLIGIALGLFVNWISSRKPVDLPNQDIT